MARQPQGIKPYWECFPAFFRYPLSPDPLLSCLGVALLVALGDWLFMPLNIAAQFAAWAVCARFAFQVLEKTAIGHLHDNPAGLAVGHGGQYLAYKQIVVALVAGVSFIAVASLFGQIAASL
ncbi:hypothetical protein [Chitinimonas taiwanensis]|uniref:hypothetical protein n=1 Tax=Chitinimonas taiwanensis TaxID=240412 RepID=UPI0035AEBE4C